uniref:Hexosyltransferase n=2 Tax=Ciona savignyi TaxID=51511 RepID=H2YYE7_CIOSA
MGTKFLFMATIVFMGSISYMMIAILLPIHNRHTHDYLMLDYVDVRPPNTYLREPWRLLKRMCFNEACSKEKKANWTLVTFIKSKVDNFKRRELMRKTWPSINFLNGARFETVFLLGKTEDKVTIALLDEEHERYGDLLQFSGPDEYDKMPYKVLSGMEWATYNLDKDFLYGSADDDFLVNIETLVENVTAILNWTKWEALQNGTFDYRDRVPLMCMFVKGEAEQPMRNPGLKWYVSFDEYRPLIYPPYCHGGLYVTSVPVATRLWNESRTAPMLRLDDVWITGILRRRMNFSDDLVYKMPKLAKHFGTVNEKVTKVMTAEWETMFESFENKSTLCTCVL